MTFFYLATPYSRFAAGIDAAFRAAAEQAALFVRAGLPVYSPIAHTHPVALYGNIDPLDHNVWLPADAPFMQAAKALVVCKLDGWDKSYGIGEEIKAFRAAGKQVIEMEPGEVPAECFEAAHRHKLIAFAGYAGSGKDTAAQSLIDLGWERVAFADAVREALLALNPAIPAATTSGAVVPQMLATMVKRFGWQAMKESSGEVRQLLQRLGTEAGRNIHGPDCWTNIARRKIEAAGGPVVITDCRFANEAAMVRGMGGRVIRIDRPGVGPKNDHASERLEFEPDYVISNSGTVAELHERVLELAEVKEAVA